MLETTNITILTLLLKISRVIESILMKKRRKKSVNKSFSNKKRSAKNIISYPCPERVKVQMVLSKTRAAFAALNRERQSAFVKVWTVKNCKLAAADPGLEVCPQPEATTETPPPTKADPREAGAMVEVVATLLDVSRSEISLASVKELYDGWLTMRDTPNVVPPVVREMAPITTMVFPPERPTVQ